MFLAPTYQTGVQILPGAWVRVLSPRRVWHHGIVRRLIPRWDGGVEAQIANNVKLAGISISDWYVFAEGREITLHRRAPAPEVPAILHRVDESMGKQSPIITAMQWPIHVSITFCVTPAGDRSVG
jgi:hypothetical protein